MPRHNLLYPIRFFTIAGLMAACIVASAPADVVILKDGFVIQGTIHKEMTDVVDKGTGISVKIPKGNGFDIIDEGPKAMIFSSHYKQLGAIEKDVKIRPDYKAYKNPLPGRKSNHPMPFIGGIGNPPDFDAKWHRTLRIQVPDGFDLVEQQITYLDPYTCWIVSPTHNWRLSYRTSEMDPFKVRKLLSTHPELAEPDKKPDPVKRIAIARFLKDVGWLQLAQDEIAQLRKDVPGPLAKDTQEQFDKFLKEMDVATGELVATEAELALHAGRYKYAGELLAAFPEKTADPKDLGRVTKVMAQVKGAQEQYNASRRLLRALIDDVTGDQMLRTAVGAAGGPIAVVWPQRGLANTQVQMLAAAAEQVYRELHPDSAGRIEVFVSLAEQVSRDKAAGKEPSKKPEELLATAVSGWVKGRNGASPQVDIALRVWQARELTLQYQREPTRNGRNLLLDRYKKAHPIGMDELAQVISLLPPADPEDLSARTGTLLPERSGAPAGTYRRKTASTSERPGGIDYLIKLPPEYHHGRAYPVLIALTHPSMDTELVMQALSRETERHGYILVAPEWAQQFGKVKGWDYKGEDHEYVTDVLRDVVRHFTVDNDRVFLFGIGDGANMALDVGVSHPDLFAGVQVMGPNPKWQGFFLHYWQNAQKLPIYVVTGEQAPFQNLRFTFERWMPRGFPAVMAAYKGRGIEWYSAETPVMFDWMSRKKRVPAASVLPIPGGAPMERWQIMRPTDNRFFWLSVDKLSPSKMIENAPPNMTPASLSGDIKGNLIKVSCQGAKQVTIWLSRDMINWAAPVRVQLNGTVPYGWRPKVMVPDLEVLLEDFHERGDRRMLFLNKLEFPNAN